ncbi:zinc-dependent alcohol dehydrogenase family protein [Blastomonas sp.]|uniref:zinc-dependent alcohol dehydrogenase family protein n=1 Tax=Blastomonas sp. TaxID=1909299 RepID=UPI00391DD114
MAKVVRFPSFGGPEVLQLDDCAVADPGPGEVRVRVAAFGLNRVETLYRSGGLGPVRFPATIGYEAAGVIDAVGADVPRWQPGDRVATLYGLSMEHYGTHGETILYPADMLVAVPDAQPLVEAAASWMMYGTAYALVEVGRISRGDMVVITAASSSVGVAAIQIANDFGAVPVAITRTRQKAARLIELGAAHVIVSDEESPAERIMAITQGKGARIVFDAVAGPPLAELLTATAPLGVVIVYGMLGGYSVDLALPALMVNNLTLRGFSADLLIAQPESRARVVDYVSFGVKRGALKPVIDRTFDLSQIVEAHRYLEGNGQAGKIVVTTRNASA